ncbi:MAG: hypothetical protein ACLTS6_18120 [Anaerobutyricum sp.]
MNKKEIMRQMLFETSGHQKTFPRTYGTNAYTHGNKEGNRNCPYKVLAKAGEGRFRQKKQKMGKSEQH